MASNHRLHPQLPADGKRWPCDHVLIVLPPSASARLPAALPAGARRLVEASLKRRGQKPAVLSTEPCVVQGVAGELFSVCTLDAAASAFEQGTALRKALAPLLLEHPAELAVALLHPRMERAPLAARALFAARVNGASLPVRKSVKAPQPLGRIHLMGLEDDPGRHLHGAESLAQANTLARTLTLLPPNELQPASYRRQVRELAAAKGWKHREYDIAQLRRLKAGAFLAVAQGSAVRDAAIVHLSWKPKGARGRLALVGKGICFDTGGHNLKNARGMFGMHEDMNGSAVALATLQALSALALPVEVHCFLALAQNHISPTAYRQNEVVTALNGTTIEIVHTDAEGRMVLADTLTLAGRSAPDLLIDYATLTGSMITALGTRQSGVMASTPELDTLARAAGAASGERVVCFAAEPDYDAALESKVADIRQCLQEGEADHLLAARFLNRFRGKGDWIHVDLSSYRHDGGLGAVASDVNGFGVAWTCALVERWLATQAS